MAQPSPVPPADPYSVLGVSVTATLDEIKTAYFALVREHPPERDPEAFKRIRAAYEQVRDPGKRLETDLLRLQPWPEPSLASIVDGDFTPDLSLERDDVILAARALSDVDRRDFREDYREVKV